MADEKNQPKVLDLRPEKGTLVNSLLTLGLRFQQGDGVSQTWADYGKNLECTVEGSNILEATEATFTDLTSRLCTTVTAEQLATVEAIITWDSGTAQ